MAEWLKAYGPWAVVVLCIGAIMVLWRQLIADRKEHVAQLVAIGKEHKAEMTVVLDRLIASSNTQVEKFANLADQSQRVIDSLTRRVKLPREGP